MFSPPPRLIPGPDRDGGGRPGLDRSMKRRPGHTNFNRSILCGSLVPLVKSIALCGLHNVLVKKRPS